MVNRLLFIGVLLLALTACNSNLETVEQRDEQGRIERFQRRKKDSAKQGLYQRLSPEGKVVEEGHYENDTLNGEHKFFYPSGQLESVERFRRGTYHGKYQKYYENGKLELEQEYVDGVMQGLSLGYYPSGALKEKVTMRDSDENGPFTEYHENGKLKAEGFYKNGPFEEGELKEYDENGQLERIADCVEGRCNTRWLKEGYVRPDSLK